MAPIRIALVGLSSKAITSWAASAHLPYLVSPRGKSRYEIVALLNSSASAAEAAREQYKLPSTVKAYGDPAAVAADPDVDLVVVNTRVDVHYPAVEPSVRAGKAVFVEWPLADNLDRALALTKNQRMEDSLISTQRRLNPAILMFKELLDSGRIGRILSSDIRAFNDIQSRNSRPQGLSYFMDRAVGGNYMTIHYGHLMDLVHYVLGDYETFHSRLQIQRPNVDILDENKEIARTVSSNVPDLISVHGVLAQGKLDIVKGATLSLVMRNSPPFKGKPGFIWSVSGEKGELLLTSPNGPTLHPPITIELHDHTTEKVTEIPWEYKDWQNELPAPARDVAELYERYAQWVENGKPSGALPEDQDWPRLHDAIERHREIQELWDQFDAQKI